MRILIVENERKLAALLRRGLEEHGHAVDTAYDGEQGLELSEAAAYDVIVLDVLLPGLNGFAVCRQLRALGPPAASLMLTARDAVEDRVAGLDCGADDYLVKPFAFAELLARIRALLRRNGRDRDHVLRAGDLELDPATRKVRRGLTVSGDETRLTQLIVNLVENGLMHTPAGGRVTVTAAVEPDGAAALLSVRDTGVGIAAEYLPHLFERFYRVDPSRTSSGGVGWAWPSAGGSPKLTAGASKWRAGWGWAARFVCAYPI
jgi:DNA-binding response OmpR family regulator